MEGQKHRKDCQGECCKKNKKRNKGLLAFIFLGLGSLIWLILRSGKKPSRLQYPCQKVAASNSLIFLGWVVSILTGHVLFKKVQTLSAKGRYLALISILFSAGIVAGWGSLNKFFRGIPAYEAVSQGANSRVVWVTDSFATTGWSGDSSLVNAARVQEMMDEAVKAYAGKATTAEAWSTIFRNHNGGADYAAGEKIAIKVNFNNSDCSSTHCPTYQTVNALLKQLVNDKGISQQDIGIFDTSRSFQNYFSSNISSRYPGVKMNPDWSQWPPCTSSERIFETGYFGCLLTESKYLINMPILRTHGGPGVTLSLKNNFGDIFYKQSTGRDRYVSLFHENYENNNVSTNSLIQLNNRPVIKNKTLVTFADALYGLKSGGPFTNPNGPNGITNPYPNSIFLSEDPIAADSVMMDYIQSRGSNFNGKNPRLTYSLAAQAGLGNYESSCNGTSCSFNYSVIDLIRCNHQGTMDNRCTAFEPIPEPEPIPLSSCESISGPEGEVEAGAALTYQGSRSAGTVNTIQWFLDNARDPSGDGKLTYQTIAPSSGTHTVRMSVNGDNIENCRKSFTVRVPGPEICPGGTWTTHPNGCRDSCFYAKDPNLSCAPVVSEGCQCGADNCWNGFNCVANPAAGEPAVRYGITELISLASKWGSAGPIADIDQNGVVNIDDLIILVKNWGS